MPVGQYEITEERVLNEPRARYYVGVRTFEVVDGSALQLSKELHYTDWPDTMPSGRVAPKVKRTQMVWGPNGRNGVVRVKAYYESTGVGFGQYFVYMLQEKRKVYREPEGDKLLVEGFDSDGKHEWRVVAGSNWRTSSNAVIRVDTSYDAANLPPFSAILGLADKMNDSSLTIGAGVGTLAEYHVIYKNVQFSRKRFGGQVGDASFYFMYNAGGWDNSVEVGMGVWFPEKRPLVESGAETTSLRSVMTYRPGMFLDGGTLKTCVPATETRSIFYEGDLSALNLSTLVAW